jgi:hypothetical protein
MGTNSLKYVIDTGSFIALKYVYPLDVFPGVWDLMSRLAQDGVIGSVDEVMEELKSQEDDLLKWAKKYKSIFLPLDEQIQKHASAILAAHENLLDLKKRKSGADPFVIAAAVVNSSIVVTEEKPSGGPQKAKIPDVCKAHGITCITVLKLLEPV